MYGAHPPACQGLYVGPIQIEFHCDRFRESVYLSFHPFYDLKGGEYNAFEDVRRYTARVRWKSNSENNTSLLNTVSLEEDNSDRNILYFDI